MYQDSASPDRPVDMETDGPLLDDFNMLKKTVEEEATEVRRSLERKAVCVCHRLRQSTVLNLSSRPDPERTASRAPADAEEI